MRGLTSILRKARGGAASERGSVAIVAALAISGVLAFVALGAQVGFWYTTNRDMQGAADAAALGGAHAYMNGQDIAAEAKADAAQYGFEDGVNGVTVTVNNPPASGRESGVSSSVEVIITKQESALLAGPFMPNPTLSARSVAGMSNAGTACVLALSDSASGAVTLANNASITDTACGVAVNSDSSSALVLDNNAVVDSDVTVHGQWSLGENAELDGKSNVENGPATVDPYASVDASSSGSCTTQSGSAKNNAKVDLQPGHFCSGWSFGNNATVKLAAGVYYVDDQLSFGNNATITGDGVTIVTSGDYAISIGNNANITLSATASGTYAGLVLYANRDGSSTAAEEFGNNASLSIDGAIYTPNQPIDLSNNDTLANTGCTQLVGLTVALSNNADLESNCSGVGGTDIATAGNGVALQE